jgi:hypothetical protein
MFLQSSCYGTLSLGWFSMWYETFAPQYPILEANYVATEIKNPH